MPRATRSDKGRKRKPPAQQQERRTIRIDDETWEQARQQAEAAGLTVSAYIRGLLQRERGEDN